MQGCTIFRCSKRPTEHEWILWRIVSAEHFGWDKYSHLHYLNGIFSALTATECHRHPADIQIYAMRSPSLRFFFTEKSNSRKVNGTCDFCLCNRHRNRHVIQSHWFIFRQDCSHATTFDTFTHNKRIKHIYWTKREKFSKAQFELHCWWCSDVSRNHSSNWLAFNARICNRRATCCCSSLSFQFTEHIARQFASRDRLYSCEFHSHSEKPLLSLSHSHSYHFRCHIVPCVIRGSYSVDIFSTEHLQRTSLGEGAVRW